MFTGKKRVAVSGRKLNTDARTRGLLPWRRDFNAVEVLLVIAIIGILGAVIIVSALRFFGTSTLNAANTEMGTVRTAAFAYYGQTGQWPADSVALAPWIQGIPKAVYLFDHATGLVTGASAVTWSGITWSPPPGPPYRRDGSWTRQRGFLR
jgi:type II secretory pathway pseudopilin PulG